jgi:predicted P-loop ATPase
MKIFKLLQELYIEIKILNQNMENFTMLETEMKRRRKNPLKGMTDVEILGLKRWINKRLQDENITFDTDSYNERIVRKFLAHDHRHATKPVRNHLSAAFGYSSFEELLEAFTKSKGGAA